MRLLCVGISHKTADVALRERLAFGELNSRRALLTLRDRFPDAEFVVLGTCNRSEIYCARAVHGHPRESELMEFLGNFHGLPPSDYAAKTYTLVDNEVVAHLFRVACGIESMVVGESQILAQVKQAYSLASEQGLAGKMLNPLFQLSLNVAKHVQSETDISAGRVSVAGVAVDVAAAALGHRLRDGSLSVLCVGAGKMSALMLRRLRELGCGRIVILNRSLARAQELAKGFAAEAGAIEELPERLAEADVVVTSTGSPAPIITRPMAESILRRRSGREMLLIDIAVPRDVAADVSQVAGVRLYNIDDLSETVQASVQSRAAQVAQCEQIVQEHVREFESYLAAQEVTPTIKALRRRLRQIAEQELLEALRKLQTHEDSAEDQRIIQRALHRLVQRILHAPTENLRRHGGSEAARMHASALRKLFDLEGHDSGGEA